MMVFSNKKSIADGLAIKIRRAHTMAKSKGNIDFNIAHPDWTRDAQTKNYAVMDKKVKEQFQKHLDIIEARRKKLGGK